MRPVHFYRTDHTYRVWQAMKNRCDNKNNPRYSSYGGRGIKYQDSWAIFDNFLADMGEAPEKRSLDRIDNNSNYCKENCRWATAEEQQRNTRRSKLTKDFVVCIKYAQKNSTLSDRELAWQLSSILGVKFETVREVLKGRCWK